MVRILFGALALTGFVLSADASAAVVTKRITFVAGPFNGANNTIPPITSVAGALTFTYDPTLAGSQGDVTVNSMSIAYTGTVRYIIYDGGVLGFASTNYLNLTTGIYAPVGANGFAGVFYDLTVPAGVSTGTFNYSQVGYQDRASTRTVLATDITTPAVPEPVSWAMMIGGLGLIGVALRRQGAVGPDGVLSV